VPDLADAERILRARLGPALHVRFPIAPLTTFRIGGPAALFVDAQDDAALTAVGEAAAVSGDRKSTRLNSSHRL